MMLAANLDSSEVKQALTYYRSEEPEKVRRAAVLFHQLYRKAYGRDATPDLDTGLDFLRALGLQALADGPNGRHSAATILYMLVWGRLGMPTFHLNEALLYKFSVTDCSSLKAEEFRLPFPAFRIAFPPTDLFMVRSTEDQVGPAPYFELMQYVESTELTASFESFAKLLELKDVPDGRFRRKLIHTGFGPLLTRLINAPDDDEDLERFLNADSTWDGSESGDSLKRALRVTVNTVLYINSLQAREEINLDVKPSKPKGTKTPYKRWSLGRKIKLAPDLKRMIRDEASLGAGTGTPLRAQVSVRGHWRNQPFGPKRSKRKLVWIEPYTKGPDTSKRFEKDFFLS